MASPVFRIAAVLLLSLVLGGPCPAAGMDQLSVAAIKEEIRKFHGADRRHVRGIGITSVPILSQLYRQNEFRPLWVDPAALDQLFQAIYAVNKDGLDPEDYHLGDLLRLRAEVRDPEGRSATAASDFDLLLTDSFIRLAFHLSYGKANPGQLHSARNLGKKNSEVLSARLLLSAIRSGDVFDFLGRLKPQVPYYLKLRTALAAYRETQRRGGWRPIPEDAQFVKGESGPHVALLRERLLCTGDLTEPSADPELFDDEAELGVVRFKIRNNLGIDPAIRRTTVFELNRPVDYWIGKLRVNLERSRWVLHDLPSEYVVVDVAGFYVYFYREREIVWRSRIQVGDPYRQTPSFRSGIDRLELNPTWTVPPGVLEALMLPEARKDPQYLNREGFTVVDARGRAVDPSTVNWAAYTAKSLPYRLRQGPGPTNPMGDVKFHFPNEFLIFLHDTPEQEAFEDSQRAFSFGCVRVEKPLELAALLLNDPSRWGLEQILQITQTKKPRAIRLPKPMPIILVYMTVLVERDGTLFFREDIYERDKAVLDVLNRRHEALSYPEGKGPAGRSQAVNPG
jgi:murein L,D-transpeptidase YcbB/YkuD